MQIRFPGLCPRGRVMYRRKRRTLCRTIWIDRVCRDVLRCWAWVDRKAKDNEVWWRGRSRFLGGRNWPSKESSELISQLHSYFFRNHQKSSRRYLSEIFWKSSLNSSPSSWQFPPAELVLGRLSGRASRFLCCALASYSHLQQALSEHRALSRLPSSLILQQLSPIIITCASRASFAMSRRALVSFL